MEHSDRRRIGDILKEKERNIEIIGADLATRQSPSLFIHWRRRAPRAPPKRTRRRRRSVPAALSYGVVVRWPPAVAHGGTGLSDPCIVAVSDGSRSSMQ
jgi:hypothetical protein